MKSCRDSLRGGHFRPAFPSGMQPVCRPVVDHRGPQSGGSGGILVRSCGDLVVVVQLSVRPGYMPFMPLRFGLTALEDIAVVIALLIAPAMLAGSLAGDKERGTLGLLLTTNVNSWEIVTGRLIGKLVPIGIILLAGFPLWVLLAGLAGIRVPALLGMIGLPTFLAIGSGGVSLAASAVSRKGRDALLTVYLVGFVLIPLITTVAESYFPAARDVLAPLNPFHGVRRWSGTRIRGPPRGPCSSGSSLGASAWASRPGGCVRLALVSSRARPARAAAAGTGSSRVLMKSGRCSGKSCSSSTSAPGPAGQVGGCAELSGPGRAQHQLRGNRRVWLVVADSTVGSRMVR